MVEVFCVCGEWSSNETSQWKFIADKKRTASFIQLEEYLEFDDLLKVVSEDFQIQEEHITMSYGFSLELTTIVEDNPPISIGNTRQLSTFISKVKGCDGICRLCVKILSDSSSFDKETTDTGSVTFYGEKQTPRYESVSAVPLNSPRYESVSAVLLNAPRCEGVSAVPLNSPRYEGVSSVPLNALPDFSPVHIGLSPTTRGAGDIKVNSYFKNKDELLSKIQKWALEWKFEYRTVSSNRSRVVLRCVGNHCSWWMRATKLPSSDFFVIKKYVHEHTCDTTHRNANHRQASTKLLGSLICSNYGEKKEGLKPKQIIEHVRIQHGVHINYKQAWRVKEVAQNLVRGTPEDSYYNLSKWLYKVQEKNPGTLTYLQKDAAGKFKYTFFAFGASIRGFSLMRRVIAVDGTFLKGKFKGTLLAACAQDGDYHIYPLAFGIADAENAESWTWFFRGLSQMIPDASDLVFVSDRAISIASALENIYPLAHHGICRIHLIRNITPKYSKTGLLPLVKNAADAYTFHEFSSIFIDIKDRCPKLAKYLEDSDFRKWARCFAPSNRYNIMTTNIAESFNSLLKLPRELPLISLLETIRLTLTTWFFERREAAAKHKHLVTPKVVEKLRLRLGAALKLNVYQVDRSEFEVKDDTMKYVVDLEKRHCTCNVFDIDKIPCIHAIAAAKHSKIDENRYVDNFHLTETWAKAYAETIHPGGELSSCTYPETVGDFSCPPPTTKKSSGRPPTKRKRSVGEFGVPGSKSQSHKCTRCGIGGHNKSTCKTGI